MFAFLRGTVAAKQAEEIHLDVNGTGYRVLVPDRVQRRLFMGQEATFLTHCHIREDAFTIYGFVREDEKALFGMLLGVGGIGPKVALSILSAMNVRDFARALLDSDVDAFTKIGGVGKKTAQRIVLEMKAKMGQDTELKTILGEEDHETDESSDDVIAALIAMGCTAREATGAAGRARKQLGETAPEEELVKAALQSLARV